MGDIKKRKRSEEKKIRKSEKAKKCLASGSRVLSLAVIRAFVRAFVRATVRSASNGRTNGTRERSARERGDSRPTPDGIGGQERAENVRR